MPGPRGRFVVGTEIVALGVIGFSANCLVVMANTIGIEKKNPEKLPQGWGLIHIVLGILMWPGTHGKAGALKVNAYLLIILALLGFYIAFGFFFPGFPGGALPF